MQPPDITRVFKGLQMEFEVEIVFGNEGNQSPEEAHDYDEILVVAAGVIELTRGPGTEVERYSKYDSIVLPAGSVHKITGIKGPVKVVIIHPDRPT